MWRRHPPKQGVIGSVALFTCCSVWGKGRLGDERAGVDPKVYRLRRSQTALTPVIRLILSINRLVPRIDRIFSDASRNFLSKCSRDFIQCFLPSTYSTLFKRFHKFQNFVSIEQYSYLKIRTYFSALD